MCKDKPVSYSVTVMITTATANNTIFTNDVNSPNTAGTGIIISEAYSDLVTEYHYNNFRSG